MEDESRRKATDCVPWQSQEQDALNSGKMLSGLSSLRVPLSTVRLDLGDYILSLERVYSAYASCLQSPLEELSKLLVLISIKTMVVLHRLLFIIFYP